MKNLKHYRFAAVFAVIALTITTCSNGGGGGNNKDKDTGGGGADVRIKTFNNGGTTPAGGRAIGARAVGSYGTDESSFAKYTMYYSSLGTPKLSITPTKFIWATLKIIFCAPNVDIYNSLEWANLASEGITHITVELPYCDFVNETTMTIGDVPPDFTCAAIIIYGFNFSATGDNIDGKPYFKNGVSRVEFEWPGGETAFNSYSLNKHLFGTDDHFINLPSNQKLPTWDGNKVTVPMAPFIAFHGSDGFSRVIYDSAATQRRFDDSKDPTGLQEGRIIIPCNSVKIPSSGPVTFNLSWDMKEMIEVYEGATSSSDDDIFILKKDFWESLYIHVTY